jgi:hypothetical protein
MLQATSSWCRCCSFLLDAVNANTRQPYSGNDFIYLSTQPVGSQHITAIESDSAQPKPWLHRLMEGNVQTTEHRTYHRPSLRLYRPQKHVRPIHAPEPLDHHIPGLRLHRLQERIPSFTVPKPFDAYIPEHIAFILPAAAQSNTTNEDSSNLCAFLGRYVEANVDMSLVRSWLYKCASRHQGKPASHSARMFSFKRDNWATDVDGCQPNVFPIKDFRLIDVANRCVVCMEEPVDYAALSYVWGNATRLLLGKDNQMLLSTPGALRADNDQVPKTFKDAFEVAQSLSITYLWIDSLCIFQDDPDQLMKHMEQMEAVYSGAVLTIVSDTESADTGIPGISMPRRASQASFTRAGTTYLSTRKTFGEALKDSPWEKRAWCLQEKIFAKRLLIFTEAQAFYHCGAATWFEDTVLEERQNISGPVHIREKAKIGQKGSDESPHSAAYEAHREYFGRNFWSLVRIYSRREISFESDTLRAFAGVLKSVEDAFGPAIWGIPAYEFTQGLTWMQSSHRLDLRQHDFPSWSWAGWRFNTSVDLSFVSCKRSDSDLRVLNGRYLVSTGKQAGRSAWDIDWYYHSQDCGSNASNLIAIPLKPHKNSSFGLVEPIRDFLSWTSSSKLFGLTHKRHVGHWRPRTEYDAISPLAYAVPCEQCKTTPPALKPPNAPHTIPSLNYNAPGMPPRSHILRFYTSVATVFIDRESNSPAYFENRRSGNAPIPYGKNWVHKLLLPGTAEHIGFVELDPSWSGIGKLHDLVYISRWCPNFAGYEDDQITHPERLNLLLTESVQDWSEVKRRVQIVRDVELTDWRKAELRWEVVSLA